MTEAQYYQQYMRNLISLEKPFARQFKTALNKMLVAAASAAEHGQPREAQNIVRRFEQEQRTILMTRYLNAAGVFGRLIDGTIESPAQKELLFKGKLSESFWDAITRWAKNEAAAKIKRISKTSKQMIASAVDAGINEGESNWMIAERIRDLKRVTEARAMLIARTETHNAAGRAADAMSATMKFEQEKKWLAANDERTRASHKEMDGKDWIDADKKFNVGGTMMDHPGDSAGGPENVCNCRCAVMYRKKAGAVQTPKPVPTSEPIQTPVPKPNSGAVFVPAKTQKEAEDFAKNVLGVNADYSKYHIRNANAMNESILQAKNEFGDIPNLKKIEKFDGQKLRYADGVYYKDGSIAIRGVEKENYSQLMGNRMQVSKKSGYYSTGSDKHIYRHEVGHAVFNGLPQDKKNSIEKIYDARAVEFSKTGTTKLSKYGMSDPDEFTAEHIAKFMDGDRSEDTMSVIRAIKGG